jgi:sulfate permease, SulP family
MLIQFFPFLRWFPMQRDTLRADLIAGLSVAMILVPQSMAYAALAGLPVVYGLYASFLPVMVASMWGASRFLHTGPVALLSLMSAAAIEPLARRGSEEFIQYSLLLALMVGVLRLALGLFRMGVLINLASHPVIIGFTNAAALIIGLSLMSSFINVPMPRSDTFLLDLWQVVQQLPFAHWPTIAFGLGTLAVLSLLKRHYPRAPGVLIVVILGTLTSFLVDFEKSVLVTPNQIEAPAALAAYEKYAATEAALKAVKIAQGEVRHQIRTVGKIDQQDFTLEAEALRLQGEEESLKQSLYGQRVMVYRFALVPVTTENGSIVYRSAAEARPLNPPWRFAALQDGNYKLANGGQVVGAIPSGVPGFSLPSMDIGIISGLFITAFIMAMIGFMEATSISRALAAKTREKIDPNQELIGQGLANIVGSFFQSYVVSGSFSRSAVAARVGAKSGFYALVSAMGVLLVMLFFTGYLYHLPQSVLAAIVMSTVFSLIDVNSLRHAWQVRRADGMIGLITFAATLIMAPQLADGVMVGVALTIMVFLAGTMRPRSDVLALTSDGRLVGAAGHDLAPISEDYVVLRFDASLVFINAAYFEQAVLKALAQFPRAQALLVIGNSINRIDATGEEKLRALAGDLKAAGVTLMLSGLKKPVREALVRAGLDEVIGAENLFASKAMALKALEYRYPAAEQRVLPAA